MQILNISFLVLVIAELFLLILAAANFFALFPINLHKFEDLPKEVRKDVRDNVQIILDGYKDCVARKECAKKTGDVFYLRFLVQSCEPNEKAPKAFEPWPLGWVHYMCASPAILDWCSEDMFMYKTSEKKMTLNSKQELHVGVSCYRTKDFNRLLHDNDENFLKVAGSIFPFICIIKFLKMFSSKSEKDEEEKESSEKDQKRKTGGAINRQGTRARSVDLRNRRRGIGMPMEPAVVLPRNIVSRRDNYKNRR